MNFIDILVIGVCFVLGYTLRAIQSYVRKPKYDGTIEVSSTDASQIYRLEIETPPDQLKDLDRVLFKVEKIADS